MEEMGALLERWRMDEAEVRRRMYRAPTPGSGKGGTRYGYWRKVGRLRRWPMCWNEMPIPLANGQRRSRSADRRRWFLTRCPASTIFAGWRQSVLPVHLLGLAPLLGSVGAVAGDVKLQDDGVVHDPVNRRGGGHGVGKDALPLREDQV